MQLFDSELRVYTTSINLRNKKEKKSQPSAHFSSTHIKFGMIQRLAGPLHKDDTQIHEVCHIIKEEKNVQLRLTSEYFI